MLNSKMKKRTIINITIHIMNYQENWFVNSVITSFKKMVQWNVKSVRLLFVSHVWLAQKVNKRQKNAGKDHYADIKGKTTMTVYLEAWRSSSYNSWRIWSSFVRIKPKSKRQVKTQIQKLMLQKKAPAIRLILSQGLTMMKLCCICHLVSSRSFSVLSIVTPRNEEKDKQMLKQMVYHLTFFNSTSQKNATFQWRNASVAKWTLDTKTLNFMIAYKP